MQGIDNHVYRSLASFLNGLCFFLKLFISIPKKRTKNTLNGHQDLVSKHHGIPLPSFRLKWLTIWEARMRRCPHWNFHPRLGQPQRTTASSRRDEELKIELHASFIDFSNFL